LKNCYVVVAATPETATTQLLQHQKQQLRSCCNTRNNKYIVAATPETTTTQLLQHQKQQLYSCCNTRGSNYFKHNNWNTRNSKAGTVIIWKLAELFTATS